MRWPLEAAYLGGCHGRTQAGVFAGAFDNAAPAGIPGDVEHRAEGPVQACGAGFPGCHGLGPFGYRRIPRRGHGQRHGEDRAVAVDHIQGEEQRDLRRALFDGNLLKRVELLRVVEPQDRAGPALPDDLFGLRPWEEQCARNLGELPDLLFEAHPCQEGLDTRCHLSFRYITHNSPLSASLRSRGLACFK